MSPILLKDISMALKEKVAELVSSVLHEDSFFLVEVVVSGNVSHKKVKVLVDGDQGINIDDCARISRGLADVLEAEGIMEQQYTLEVSSPGVDWPLKLVRQYKKNTGRKVAVTLKEGAKIEGVLLSADENVIVIEVQQKKEKKQVEIPYNKIEKTKVLISFKRDG